MSDLVQPAGRLEVAAHIHLEDEDGHAMEQEDHKKEEEGCLECHQGVVGGLV